jgi:ribosomal protein L29
MEGLEKNQGGSENVASVEELKKRIADMEGMMDSSGKGIGYYIDSGEYKELQDIKNELFEAQSEEMAADLSKYFSKREIMIILASLEKQNPSQGGFNTNELQRKLGPAREKMK